MGHRSVVVAVVVSHGASCLILAKGWSRGVGLIVLLGLCFASVVVSSSVVMPSLGLLARVILLLWLWLGGLEQFLLEIVQSVLLLLLELPDVLDFLLELRNLSSQSLSNLGSREGLGGMLGSLLACLLSAIGSVMWSVGLVGESWSGSWSNSWDWGWLDGLSNLDLGWSWSWGLRNLSWSSGDLLLVDLSTSLSSA